MSQKVEGWRETSSSEWGVLSINIKTPLPQGDMYGNDSIALFNSSETCVVSRANSGRTPHRVPPPPRKPRSHLKKGFPSYHWDSRQEDGSRKAGPLAASFYTGHPANSVDRGNWKGKINLLQINPQHAASTPRAPSTCPAFSAPELRSTTRESNQTSKWVSSGTSPNVATSLYVLKTASSRRRQPPILQPFDKIHHQHPFAVRPNSLLSPNPPLVIYLEISM